MANRSLFSQKQAALRAKILNLIAGFQAKYTPQSTLTVAGHSMTQPQIIAALQAKEAFFENVEASDAAKRQSVTDKDAGLSDAPTLVDDIVAAVRADKGSTSSDLPAFGVEPPKPRKRPDTATAVVAQARRAATRKARGILGKNQRAKITVSGTPGVAVVNPDGQATPVVAPIAAASTATATPASSANGTPAESSAPSAPAAPATGAK